MRSLHLTAVACLGLAAASGCTLGAREPQAAATQGGEAGMLATPQTLAVTDRSNAQFAARLSEAYGPELEAAKVVPKGPALSAGELTVEHAVWKQAGAKLNTAKANNLDDLPKCQEL
jgi:hypothetical protein